MTFSVYSLHVIFNNKILTISASILSIFIVFYTVLPRKNKPEEITGLIKSNNSLPEKQDGFDIVSFLITIFWLAWAVLFLIGIISYYNFYIDKTSSCFNKKHQCASIPTSRPARCLKNGTSAASAARKLDNSPGSCIYLDIRTAHSNREVSHVVQSSEMGKQSRGAYS